MVDRFSNQLAVSINRNATNASSVAVLQYALSVLLNFLIFVCIVLIICIATGRITDGLAAIIAFPMLRYFSGGLHFRSANVCNVVSSLLVLLAIYAPVSYWYNGLVFNMIAVLVLTAYAPSGIKKSKLPPRFYPVLKLIAVLIVCSNFLIQSPLIATVFLIQSITIMPVFQKTLDKLNW